MREPERQPDAEVGRASPRRDPPPDVTLRAGGHLPALRERAGRAADCPACTHLDWVYDPGVPERRRRARVEDVHEAALAMPHVSVLTGPAGNHVYQVGGKSFVFFRTPRSDAHDPRTGERWDDVIVLWVASEGDKQALVQDPSSPWFTTPHFDGHPSVLVRACRLCELDRDELVETVQDAWLARASPSRAAAWLRDTGGV